MFVYCGDILFLGLFGGASSSIRYVRCLQNVELTYKRQFARHAARIPSPIREIIAVCSQIHTKHINTVWAERRIVGC